MKILVPTDFSRTAFSAYYYAGHLAEALDAEITLLHVIEGSHYTQRSSQYEPVYLLLRNARDRMQFFAEEHPASQRIAIGRKPADYVARFGLPGFTVADYARDHDFDLIVMGTLDRHNVLMERFLGSASSTVIQHAPCPTLFIHEQTRYQTPARMVFAFDRHGDLSGPVTDFHRLNQLLGAKTDFVHVQLNQEEQALYRSMDHILEGLFEKDDPDYSFEIKSLEGDSLVDTLLDYCLFEKADWLVMVHRKHGLIHRFFNRSVSMRVAEGIHLPVLVIPEK